MRGVNSADARISIDIVRLRVESVKMAPSDAIFDRANQLLFFPIFNQTYVNMIDPIQRWARFQV